MKKTNFSTIIVLLIGIIVGLSVALVTTIVLNNNKETIIIDNTKSVEENRNIEEKNTTGKNEENDKVITKNKETKTNTSIKEQENSTDPVEYFTNISKTTDKNSLKEGFVKIVDFLFYDEPINGKKFSELKDSAKLKILEIAFSIDSKIDYYFPGYKETLSNGTKKIYNDVKIKVTELYIKIVNKICNSNSQLCIDAKKDFESLKESFGLTFEFLKDLGIEGYSKIQDWYENFREN